MDKVIDIKFHIDRRNVLLIGKYTPNQENPDERVSLWATIAEAGIQLMSALLGENAKVVKMLQYEVVEGEIVFDVTVVAKKAVKERAIKAVQEHLHSEDSKPQVVWFLEDPGVTQ